MHTLLKLSLMTVAIAALAACASQSETHEPTMGAASGNHVAQAAMESGDYQLAESIYANAAASAPNDAEAQLRYADALLRLNKVNQARDVLARGMKTVSNPKMLRSGLGAIDVLEGQPTQAIIEFDVVLAASPDDTRSLVNKAVALDLLGRHGEAQGLYRRALVAESDNVTAISDLALSLALSGHKAEAAAAIAPLVGRDDLSARVKTNMSVVTAASGSATVADSSVLQLAKAIDSKTTN